jgi:hypothetical protein
MPLSPGSSAAVISANTQKLIREGYPPAQAYAIAIAHARRTKKGR